MKGTGKEREDRKKKRKKTERNLQLHLDSSLLISRMT